MKYSAAVITAILGFVAAQDISIIPECAQSCITDAVASATDCGATDYKCVCDNKDALVGAATPCVIKSCGADVATGEVLPATEKFCEEVANGGGSDGGDSSSSAAPTESAPATTAPGTESAAPTTGYPTATTAAPTGGYNATTGGPQPTSSLPVEAGAAALGSMGGLAMLVLGAAAAL